MLFITPASAWTRLISASGAMSNEVATADCPLDEVGDDCMISQQNEKTQAGGVAFWWFSFLFFVKIFF